MAEPEGQGQEQESPEEGGLLDLEQLVALEVESASIAGRKEQRIDLTPAAVSRLGGEEIQRLGTDTLADALRAIPGLFVAREARSQFAINARGPSGLYSNQLLVMRDGRPIYTPTFAGVQWEKEDYLFADLDGIEVIRGPGSTIWGSNAVNGIINVVTKSSFDTLGWNIRLGAGSHERLLTEVRYGALVDEETAFRVFAKWFDRDGFRLIGNSAEYGDHAFGMAGFRLDHCMDDDGELMVSGEVYEGRRQFLGLDTLTFGSDLVRGVTVNRGGHLLGQWTQAFRSGSELLVNAYLEWNDQSGNFAGEARRTAEIDATYHSELTDRWSLVFGAGARYVLTSLKDSEITRFTVGDEAYYLASAFAQTSYVAIPEELILTLGTKLEVNARSGFEIQPSARLAWTPIEDHTFWTALSRSVRTPGLTDRLVQIPLGLAPPGAPGLGPTVLEYQANRDFDSEDSLTLELGWRWRPKSNFLLEVNGHSTFYDNYRSFRTLAPILEPGLPPFVRQSLQNTNQSEAHAFGLEVEAEWRPRENWLLSGYWTWTRFDVRDGNPDLGLVENSEDAVPSHVVHLRSFLDLSDDVGWNVALWFVSDMPNTSSGAYVRLDTNLTWSPTPGVTWSFGGRNLLEESNQEFTGELGTIAQRVEREFFVALEWAF